jgi:hypothetical protein
MKLQFQTLWHTYVKGKGISQSNDELYGLKYP